MTPGTRAIKWKFIVAEIEDDEGILGNDFAMEHKLTVRLRKGAVYLPDLSRARKEHMGQRLSCTIPSVTEVRAITEETLAVRAVGPARLAPHTATQVRVVVPTPGARGTVMIGDGRECWGWSKSGDGQNDGDEVNGLVERAAPHLTDGEC